MNYYTCYGPARGKCGNTHKTLKPAHACCERDQKDCKRARGYSDRVPVAAHPPRRRQQLSTMLRLIRTGRAVPVVRALNGLVGCPEGGWAETEQAWRRLQEELPEREHRSYTPGALVDACLQMDSAGRYEWQNIMKTVSE